METPETSVWDMINQGIAGSNVDLVISDENCKVMKLSDKTGEGVMTLYRIFDGTRKTTAAPSGLPKT